MTHNQQKKIAVINDFCGFGRCSLTVSLPIISALRVQCCPVPTSIFSNHTAYDSFFFTDYTKHMEAYMNEWEKLGLMFDGILTGFLGSPEQTRIVRNFLAKFKRENTVTVVDPVMGDEGKLYATYSSELADQMKELLPYADILTPNLTEACILTNTTYRRDMNTPELTDLCAKLSLLGPKKIVISGLERKGRLINFVYEEGKLPVEVSGPKIGPCRAGTGDVFSSIIAADAVNGVDFLASVRHAAVFIAKVLGRAVELEIPATDGICFEEFLSEIGKDVQENGE
ncbi:MAG: pyridoxamine kinase [Lachnospiraceae bacterium]|nr:pyridoxamine kinase [Lachnospiraceae bacterium]